MPPKLTLTGDSYTDLRGNQMVLSSWESLYLWIRVAIHLRRIVIFVCTGSAKDSLRRLIRSGRSEVTSKGLNARCVL